MWSLSSILSSRAQSPWASCYCTRRLSVSMFLSKISVQTFLHCLWAYGTHFWVILLNWKKNDHFCCNWSWYRNWIGSCKMCRLNPIFLHCISGVGKIFLSTFSNFTPITQRKMTATEPFLTVPNDMAISTPHCIWANESLGDATEEKLIGDSIGDATWEWAWDATINQQITNTCNSLIMWQIKRFSSPVPLLQPKPYVSTFLVTRMVNLCPGVYRPPCH